VRNLWGNYKNVTYACFDLVIIDIVQSGAACDYVYFVKFLLVKTDIVILHQKSVHKIIGADEEILMRVKIMSVTG
jgi:hypothetical protein